LQDWIGRKWGGIAQKSRKETAAGSLFVVKEPDSKLPIKRVVLDLVMLCISLMLFRSLVVNGIGGGGEFYIEV